MKNKKGKKTVKCGVLYPSQIKRLSRTATGRRRLRMCGIRPRKK